MGRIAGLAIAGFVAASGWLQAQAPMDQNAFVATVHYLEENPRAADAQQKRAEALKSMFQPGTGIPVCSKASKDIDGAPPVVRFQMILSGVAFQLEHPEKRADALGVMTAGVEGALRVYEIMVKAEPTNSKPGWNHLLELRNAGTLQAYLQKESGKCTLQNPRSRP